MSSVRTGKLLGKLEKVVNFRVGEEASKRCPIIISGANSCPSTDGTQIFLPQKESHFKSEKNNEFAVADYTAHEADHIREYETYFGDEKEKLREQKGGLVQEFHKRNYSELKENPTLAGWIDNIVKDRRIDEQRREQLSGIKKYHEEVLNPAAKYFRPSVKGMSELDAFREQYLQKTLIGKTIELVPEKYEKILEEVVKITSSSNSINEDKEKVTKIYEIFKKNFDITQPISKLPPMFNRGDSSQSRGGQPRQFRENPQQSDRQSQDYEDSNKPNEKPRQDYGKEIKSREGRDAKEKKPKELSDGEDFSKESNEKEKSKSRNKDKHSEKKAGGDENKKDNPENFGRDNKDREELYKKAERNYGVEINVVKADFSEENMKKEERLRDKYAGEIESMKRVFRQVQLKNCGEKRDFEGEELDYSDYLQSELEAKVTGIHGNGKYFKEKIINRQRPAWAVLADITPSTSQHGILEHIRAGLLINAEGLGVTDWPFGLFGFSNNFLYVVKDFPEKYGKETSNKIIKLEREDGGGTYLAPPLRTVGSFLRRQNEHPKGITIITDGEDQDSENAKAAIKEMHEQKINPFVIVIGKQFEKYAKELTKEIGSEHYSVVEKNKIHELPYEMFRLFKTFGIAK